MDSLFLERRSALAVNIYVLDESIDSFQLALFRDLLEQCVDFVDFLARVLFHIAPPSFPVTVSQLSEEWKILANRFPISGNRIGNRRQLLPICYINAITI